MTQNLKYFALAKIFLSALIFSNAYADNNRFKVAGHIIIDTQNNIEWLRCSVGQRWNGSNCVGQIVNLSLDTVPQAIELAGQQLGGVWRFLNVFLLFLMVVANVCRCLKVL